jgi:outer membrane protein assembly factor BamA
MTARCALLAVVGALVLVARTAAAQPGHPACNGSVAAGTPVLSRVPGYVTPPAPGPAVQWTELAVAQADPDKRLLDAPDTIRGLLLPAFDQNRMNEEPTRTVAIGHAVAAYGYQLVRVGTETIGDGVRATLFLAPLPLVRRVSINVHGSLFGNTYEDEVRHRMAVKPGAYLPYVSDNQVCVLDDEVEHIVDYLHDEGYFQASARIVPKIEADGGAKLTVDIDLNDDYVTDRDGGRPIVVDNSAIKVMPPDQIRERFIHRPVCFFGTIICLGNTTRFTRDRHLQDIADVLSDLHKLGYPAARVSTDYDPRNPGVSLDRTRKVVTFTITVDAQRRLNVLFEGEHAAVPDEELTKRLTFDTAGSSDDVEAQTSADALTAYLQTRGYFDARVTWSRRREAAFDLITFHLDLGRTREVAGVSFTHDDSVFTGEQLAGLVSTKAGGLAAALFGNTTPVTSAGLAGDADRLRDAYHHAGFPAATVRVAAATSNDRAVLASAALGVALVSADHGDALYVHFDIAAGPLTEVARVELAIDPDPNQPAGTAVCTQLLASLADALGAPALKIRDPSVAGCAATPAHVPYKDEATKHSIAALREALADSGHARATVELRVDDVEPRKVVLHYTVRHTDTLAIGHIIIRGNFHTRASIILGELQLDTGKPLTAVAIKDALRRLRAMGLFDAVDLQLPTLCTEGDANCAAARDHVDAVVRVQERYDYSASIDLSAGYSSYSGAFVTAGPSFNNLFGVGLTDLLTGTYGTKIKDIENVLRVPRWLLGHLVQGEVDAFYRVQDTPNFGYLTTSGFTVAVSRTKQYPRTGTTPAHTLSLTVHYDYRDRERDVDALRPIGIENDQTQIPVTTITGQVGVIGEWDQRVDRTGAYAPLSPERGFRLNAGVSVASTYLFGQNDFIKVTATGTKYVLIGDNFVLRGDLRYDEGFPLGGEALLPEVEQFFAGGDNTVRGYNDDALKTQLVEVSAPPLPGGITQLRVLPAGGDIRLMASLDGQVRIWRFLASGLFLDGGMISNDWRTVTSEDIRPAVGMALIRVITPFGLGAIEYAVPLHPELGDDPRGRWHFTFAARAQF